MKQFFIIVLSFVSSIAIGQRLNTPTLSPYTKIIQEVGLTEVMLEYARPSAKGRKIFGALVPFDKVWRSGANASTKITITETVQVGGHPLDSGTYAIYTIPGEGSWTIIIHGNTKLRSIAGDAYKPEDDLFRFKVKPEPSSGFVETFTLQFADLGTDSFNLRLSWENTTVNIPFKVEVDDKIAGQMATFLKDPDSIPDRTYFEAAQYYLHNDKDLGEALEWINAALEKSPQNFRYGLLKAKILDKSGDHKAALGTINEANTWATKANNANYIEQTDLFRKSLLEKNK